MCTFYKPIAQPRGLKTIKVDTHQLEANSEFYAVDCSTISNKLVVAFQGGRQDGQFWHCMTHENLTASQFDCSPNDYLGMHYSVLH
jgi:hypothetical protein